METLKDIFQFLTELAPIVAAGGVLLVWQQLKIAKETMANDHERSRRLAAIEIALDWNRSITPETSAAQKLIAGLNTDQCVIIANYHPLEIPGASEEQIDLARGCLNPDAFTLADQTLSLNSAAVKHMRYFGVSYLNSLEGVLAAWNEGVGDRKFIEREFAFVNNETTMVFFREALHTVDQSTFPAIEAFLRWNVPEPRPPVDQPGNPTHG